MVNTALRAADKMRNETELTISAIYAKNGYTGVLPLKKLQKVGSIFAANPARQRGEIAKLTSVKITLTGILANLHIENGCVKVAANKCVSVVSLMTKDCFPYTTKTKTETITNSVT